MASFFNIRLPGQTHRSSARSGTERQRYRGPLFLSDAVVPWGRETVLLDRLRKDALAAQADEDDSP
ncbi:hypothetical protein [Sulfitobacter sp. JL08]|uniref:hypothetical protein n=1 Tax=Sulfitobacter sp. JL08 TaxID=2070369 RepID=UPI0019651974|nr:hypothetical protein [Sulfitobacter sp. JL08]